MAGISRGKQLEFRATKEDWSKYEILGGQGVVWVRAVLLKVREVNPPGLGNSTGATPNYECVTQFLVTAFFDERLRSDAKAEPGDVPREDFAKKGEDLQFGTLEEPWNEYIVSGSKPKRLQIKCVATRIQLLRQRFNIHGDPTLLVDAQMILGPVREANSAPTQ